MDAFHGQGLTPHIEMETTNTEIIVRMVEAGLGVSIVPLLPSGMVTRGRRVGVRSLGRQNPADSIRYSQAAWRGPAGSRPGVHPVSAPRRMSQ